jgi:hypothetical protein
MRAAAVLAATVLVLGLFLAIAAGFSMTPSWIGIGMLAISAAGAIAVTVGSTPIPGTRTVARS